MSEVYQHQSVMLQEALQGLMVQQNGIYVDATYGRGGHGGAILSLLGDAGRLLAMDKDPDAVEHAQARFGSDNRFDIKHHAFNGLADYAEEQGVYGSVNGILFDLGVSSPHLDEAKRGFSFMREGPLDMRMDTSQGMTAAEWLSFVSEDELSAVLRDYGEEKFARRIARAIVAERELNPINTTGRLASIVASASPAAAREKHKHPATRSFQAIRIHINQELNELEEALDQALDVLAVGGRLVVISFHSLEDRIVKRFIQRHSQSDAPRGLPLLDEQICTRLQKMMGAIKPSADEVDHNARARSAVLRIAEKVS